MLCRDGRIHTSFGHDKGAPVRDDPSRYGRPRICARIDAATREVSSAGITTSTGLLFREHALHLMHERIANRHPTAVHNDPSRTESRQIQRCQS